MHTYITDIQILSAQRVSCMWCRRRISVTHALEAISKLDTNCFCSPMVVTKQSEVSSAERWGSNRSQFGAQPQNVDAQAWHPQMWHPSHGRSSRFTHCKKTNLLIAWRRNFITAIIRKHHEIYVWFFISLWDVPTYIRNNLRVCMNTYTIHILFETIQEN